MNAPRHLQNLVGAQMHPGENVSSMLDDVSESCVVDDDRVEPLHVESTLPRRSHRKEVGLPLPSLEKRTDRSDRLAAVIVGRVDSRKRRRYRFGRLLHSSSRWQKHSHTAFLPDYPK